MDLFVREMLARIATGLWCVIQMWAASAPAAGLR